MRVEILVLLYGDHLALHQRLLRGLTQEAVPVEQAVIHLWCNQLGVASKQLVQQFCLTRGQTVGVHFSDENVPKYKVMQKLLTHELSTRECWWLWLDDDVHFTSVKWFSNALEFIQQKAPENVCYFGQPWFVDYLPGQLEFVQQAPWYRGLPPLLRKGKSIIEFAQGSYWWLRADVASQLNWPDSRLNHNGGDTLLGEAIRQQRLPFHKFSDGVRPNAAPRRGFHEAPAGSTDPNARR